MGNDETGGVISECAKRSATWLGLLFGGGGASWLSGGGLFPRSPPGGLELLADWPECPSDGGLFPPSWEPLLPEVPVIIEETDDATTVEAGCNSEVIADVPGDDLPPCGDLFSPVDDS
jgi:hypothetical protein